MLIKRLISRAIYALIFGWMVLASPQDPAFAQTKTADVPNNASARQFSTGWDCNEGYREVNADCQKIKVPENAYPTKRQFGDGWKCKWGFKKSDEACIPVGIPANAYLESSGNDWAS